MYALKAAGITTHALLFDGAIIDPVPVERQPEILAIAAAECEAVCPGINMVYVLQPIELGAVNLMDEPFEPIRCPCTEITPEYLKSWGPVFEYNVNRRAQNCPALLDLLMGVLARTLHFNIPQGAQIRPRTPRGRAASRRRCEAAPTDFSFLRGLEAGMLFSLFGGSGLCDRLVSSGPLGALFCSPALGVS